MRRLTLTVTPEQAGRTVKSLLRRELRMADGAIARVKTVPDGICLNGAHARTVDCVQAGDTLTVRIDDQALRRPLFTRGRAAGYPVSGR